MSENTTDVSWLDERDPELQPGLTCHVEIEIESGDTYRDILTKAAWGLRTTALQVEAGKLDTGFHPIRTIQGEKIGEIYLDYYGTGFL